MTSASETTVVEFLLECLDWDERIARGAVQVFPNWVADGIDNPVRIGECATPGDGIAYGHTTSRRSEAAHITRHDPARVLREVEAKQQFIKTYAPPDPHEPGKCPDCDMLYALAAVYSDSVAYRKEWALP